MGSDVVLVGESAMRTRTLVLMIATLINVLSSVMVLWLAFGGTLSKAASLPTAFVVGVVINGVMVLVYLRLVITNSRLTESERNNWMIVVLVGVGFGQLLYFLRKVSPVGV
jgi:hypothetical protein